jgi:tetratricopeptide (TPR) repeat protein
MQGLDELYDHTGRRTEWKRLVEEIVHEFVDPAHGGAFPGREEEWGLVNDYRVRLARQARQWEEAERLQRTRVEWDRQRASVALAIPSEDLDHAQRGRLRMLAAGLHALAQIQSAVGQTQCVEAFRQCYELMLRIGDKPSAASSAQNLGRAYEDLPALRNLDEAERWHGKSLELRADGDQIGQAKSLMELGGVNLERFMDARKATKPAAELMTHLEKASTLSLQALDLLPSNAVNVLADVHNQIGNIYNCARAWEHALEHYRQSISYQESAGNIYGAAVTRYNVAITLAHGGRFADAKEYALAALRNFQTYGASAADKVQKTLELIAYIEKALKGEIAERIE